MSTDFTPFCTTCSAPLNAEAGVGYLLSCGHFSCRVCAGDASQPNKQPNGVLSKTCKTCKATVRAASILHPPAEVKEYLQNSTRLIQSVQDVLVFQLDHYRNAADRSHRVSNALREQFDAERRLRRSAEHEIELLRADPSRSAAQQAAPPAGSGPLGRAPAQEYHSSGGGGGGSGGGGGGIIPGNVCAQFGMQSPQPQQRHLSSDDIAAARNAPAGAPRTGLSKSQTGNGGSNNSGGGGGAVGFGLLTRLRQQGIGGLFRRSVAVSVASSVPSNAPAAAAAPQPAFAALPSSGSTPQRPLRASGGASTPQRTLSHPQSQFQQRLERSNSSGNSGVRLSAQPSPLSRPATPSSLLRRSDNNSSVNQSQQQPLGPIGAIGGPRPFFGSAQKQQQQQQQQQQQLASLRDACVTPQPMQRPPSQMFSPPLPLRRTTNGGGGSSGQGPGFGDKGQAPSTPAAAAAAAAAARDRSTQQGTTSPFFAGGRSPSTRLGRQSPLSHAAHNNNSNSSSSSTRAPSSTAFTAAAATPSQRPQTPRPVRFTPGSASQQSQHPSASKTHSKSATRDGSSSGSARLSGDGGGGGMMSPRPQRLRSPMQPYVSTNKRTTSSTASLAGGGGGGGGGGSGRSGDTREAQAAAPAHSGRRTASARSPTAADARSPKHPRR